MLIKMKASADLKESSLNLYACAPQQMKLCSKPNITHCMEYICAYKLLMNDIIILFNNKIKNYDHSMLSMIMMMGDIL